MDQKLKDKSEISLKNLEKFHKQYKKILQKYQKKKSYIQVASISQGLKKRLDSILNQIVAKNEQIGDDYLAKYDFKQSEEQYQATIKEIESIQFTSTSTQRKKIQSIHQKIKEIVKLGRDYYRNKIMAFSYFANTEKSTYELEKRMKNKPKAKRHYKNTIQSLEKALAILRNLQKSSVDWILEDSVIKYNEMIVGVNQTLGTSYSESKIIIERWNSLTAGESIRAFDGISPSLSLFPFEAPNTKFSSAFYTIDEFKRVAISYISGSRTNGLYTGSLSYKVKISRSGLSDRNIDVVYKSGSFRSTERWNSITAEQIKALDGINPSLRLYSDRANLKFSSAFYTISGIKRVAISYISRSRTNGLYTGSLSYKVKISRKGLSDRIINVVYPNSSFKAITVRTLTGHRSSVLSVAFSPDGRKIVSGSWDKTIKIWEWWGD